MTVRDIIELRKMGYTKEEINEFRNEEKAEVTEDVVENSEGDSEFDHNPDRNNGVSESDFLGAKINEALKPVQDSIAKMQETLARAPATQEKSEPTVDDILISWMQQGSVENG